MNLSAASGWGIIEELQIILFAASGRELNPKRLKNKNMRLKLWSKLLFVSLIIFSSCKDELSIRTIYPTEGEEGTLVTIEGKHFSDAKSNIVVKFADTPTETISATKNQLKVKVPDGIKLGEISITVTVRGKTVTAPKKFMVKFNTFNPSNHTVTFSDEFNGTRDALWESLTGAGWGNETFSSDSKYITYDKSGSREYLELKAYVENDKGELKNYSGGIHIPDKISNGSAMIKNPDNPFYYGYYEIESRLTKGTQSIDSIGLWPAFWFQHSERNDPEPGKYWYEEVDIFEPGACQVRDDYTAFHYWTLENDNAPHSDTNIWQDPEHEHFFYDVDMFNWHRWGVEWLPERLTFYYDGVPIHTIRKRVPFHQKPRLFIDLQLNPEPWGCANPRTTAGKFIGSFQVNYFRYWSFDKNSGY